MELESPAQPQDLIRGMSGPEVTALQNFLFQDGYRISEKEQADKFFGDTTYDALVDYQQKHKLVPNGIFDAKARWVLDDKKEHPNKFIVLGQVIDANGQPVKDKTVKAFDKELRSQKQMGTDITKQSGEYLIFYKFDDFDDDNEKYRADLFVQVFESDGTLLATSPIIFNAGKVELVNFTIGNSHGISEFEKIVNEIQPLIEGVVPQASLDGADVSFLSSETGIDAALITLLVESARRNVQANAIAQSVFYGLFRQNLPTRSRRADAERDLIAACGVGDVVEPGNHRPAFPNRVGPDCRPVAHTEGHSDSRTCIFRGNILARRPAWDRTVDCGKAPVGRGTDRAAWGHYQKLLGRYRRPSTVDSGRQEQCALHASRRRSDF